ncbi:MAG TPA: hypothetical protein VIM73_16600 [Polyangiaceae bacterium]
MSVRRGGVGCVILSLVFALHCGTGGNPAAESCVPGATQLCHGPGACEGAQVCLPDGAAYSECDCGAAHATGGAAGSSTIGEGGAKAVGGASGYGESSEAGQAGQSGLGQALGGMAGSDESAAGAGGSPPTLKLDWARAVSTGAIPQQIAVDPKGGFHISGSLTRANFGNGEVHGTWFGIDRRADGSHIAARTLDAGSTPALYRAVSIGTDGSFVSVGGVDSYYDDLTYDTNELRISKYGGWLNSFGQGKLTHYVASSFALAVAADGGAFYSSSAAVPFDGTKAQNSVVFTAAGSVAWSSSDTAQSGTFLGSGNLLMMGMLNGSHDFGGGPISGATYFVERDGTGSHVASWGLDVTFGSPYSFLSVTPPRLRTTAKYAVVEGQVLQGAIPDQLGDNKLALSAPSGWLIVTLDAAGSYRYAEVWPSIQSDSGTALTPNIHATMDALGRTFICGHFWRQITISGRTFTAVGTSDKDSDIVVAGIGVDGSLLFAQAFGSAGADTCADIAIDSTGGILITGQYQTSLDFGTGPLESQPRAATDPPMFYIARFGFYK